MIKKSFPVESSSSGGESENVRDENPDIELSFKRKSEGEAGNNGINDSVKEDKTNKYDEVSTEIGIQPKRLSNGTNNNNNSKH
jgi:hypothetical protein